MATSTCSKCGNHRFEIQEVKLANANFRHFLAQCSNCGTPVGVIDFQHTATILANSVKKIEDQIEILRKNDRIISSELQEIKYLLEKIRR